MNEHSETSVADALQRQAEEKLGRERAEALRGDILQMAKELESLRTYTIGFEDEL